MDAFESQGDLKVHLFPEEEGTILIRLANIADLFDGSPSATPYFDLEGYAGALYEQANSHPSPPVQITERTLGNSMDYKDMQKTAWKVRSATTSTYQKPQDDGNMVALEP